MKVHYLDSSAWVKHHIEEPGSTWVARLMQGGAALACSSIGVVEVLAALSRRAGLSHAQLERSSIAVRREREGFQEIDVTSAVLGLAMDLPVLYRLRGADAIHLASAMVYRASLAEDAQMFFVSSDQELLDAAAHARFTTIDPAATRSSR